MRERQQGMRDEMCRRGFVVMCKKGTVTEVNGKRSMHRYMCYWIIIVMAVIVIVIVKAQSLTVEHRAQQCEQTG